LNHTIFFGVQIIVDRFYRGLLASPSTSKSGELNDMTVPMAILVLSGD